MNQKLSQILMVLLLASCSAPEETKTEIVVKEVEVQKNSDIAEISQEEVKNLELKALVSYMAISEETFDKGISVLQEQLDKPDLNLEDAEVKEIAELLSTYTYDKEDKLYVVLGLQKNNGAKQTIRGLNEVYLDLDSSRKELSDSSERILMEYLNTTLLKYEARYSSSEDISDIAKYYEKKIIKETESSSASSVYEKYSSLTKIIPTSSYTIFKNIFKNIKVRQSSSITEHIGYNKILKEYILNQSSFDTSADRIVLSSSKSNLEWANTQYFKNKISGAVFLDILSNYFSLFDLEQVVTEKRIFRNDINDIHFDITKKIKPTLAKLLYRIDSEYLKKIRIHPYIKILINKEQMIKGLDPMFDFDNELEINNKFHNERKLFSGIKEFEINDNNFMKDYYDILSYRHSIELQTKKSGTINRIDDEINGTYDKLLSSLVSALNFFYDQNLTKEYFYTNTEESNDLFQSISSEYEEIESGVFKMTYCRSSVKNCLTKEMLPGIYTVPEGIKKFKEIQLFGAALNMSPMAVILTKGSDILISMETIEGLWIDTRGMNGTQVGLSKEEQGFTLPEVDSLSSVKTKSQSRYKWYTWSIRHTKGEQLKPQPRSNDGKNAGQIEMITSYDFSITNIPLMVTSGGNGSNGKSGQSTDTNEILEYQNVRSVGINGKHTGYMSTKIETIDTSECIGEISLIGGSTQTKSKKKRTSSHRDWSNKNRTKNIIYKIYRGKGGDAGNGAKPGSLLLTGPEIEKYDHLFQNLIATPGKGGKGGLAGECGSGDELEYQGLDGINGESNE